VVVHVITSKGDIDVILSVVDVDAHLVLAVAAEDVNDVLVCKPPLGEELTGGVGVPFEKSPATAWITAYCFMLIELKFEFL
tara:strand:- start:429 stop:671 length:243 start_codon:yes stop_codon:yes gene_type:complete